MLLLHDVMSLSKGCVMLDWKQRLLNWEGTAAELAIVLEDVLAELNISDEDLTPNERLIRHYAANGILERPERRGKEAIFGFKQIVEFLAARHLIQDGWPLAKVAEFNRTTELKQLLDVLPKPGERNLAQKLVSSFQQKSSEQPSDESKITRSSHTLMRRSAEMTKGRVSRREALEALGNLSASPERDVLVRLVLTPWCHVYFDPDILSRLPSETAELLGKALTQSLIDEQIHPGEKK
jgi:hypothetical protein